jgi:hypothetical protein
MVKSGISVISLHDVLLHQAAIVGTVFMAASEIAECTEIKMHSHENAGLTFS